MLKELRAHGPFAVSYEPFSDFGYYRNGIYQHVQWRDEEDDAN